MPSVSTSARAGSTGTGVAPAKECLSISRERDTRVAELREQYRSGAYHVDARKTALAILNHLRRFENIGQ